MCHEVGYRHVTREDEGNRTGEKADEDEKAADEFKYALNTREREQGRKSVLRRRKAKQLLRSMLQKEKPGHYAQDRQCSRRPSFEAILSHS